MVLFKACHKNFSVLWCALEAWQWLIFQLLIKQSPWFFSTCGSVGADLLSSGSLWHASTWGKSSLSVYFCRALEPRVWHLGVSQVGSNEDNTAQHFFVLMNCCLVLCKWLPFIQIIYRQNMGISGFWNIPKIIIIINLYSALVKLGNKVLWRFTLSMFLIQGQSGPSGGKTVPARPAKAIFKKRVRYTSPQVLKSVLIFLWDAN